MQILLSGMDGAWEPAFLMCPAEAEDLSPEPHFRKPGKVSGCRGRCCGGTVSLRDLDRLSAVGTAGTSGRDQDVTSCGGLEREETDPPAAAWATLSLSAVWTFILLQAELLTQKVRAKCWMDR